MTLIIYKKYRLENKKVFKKRIKFDFRENQVKMHVAIKINQGGDIFYE